MSRGSCLKSPEEQAACRERKPFSDSHHLFWPRSLYRTAIEKAFRELPQNKEQLCRCEHNDAHAEPPPHKPSVEIMRQAIALTEIERAPDAA